MKTQALRVALLLTFAPSAGLAQPGTTPSASPVFLPQAFAGWTIVNRPQISKDAGTADAASAALLKEYGFTELETATYTRDDGRKLKIKAARFQDASGSYGAFTFYQTPEMQEQKIGDTGASLNDRVLFYRGNILIDAVFDRLSAMSAAELRELADNLPRPSGTSVNLPSLLNYVPKGSSAIKYVVGPRGLEKNAESLLIPYVDFSRGAEVLLADHDVNRTNPSRFILISYPTPQIASSQLRQIEQAEQDHQLGDSPIVGRRTGPLVVLVSGQIPASDAKTLLASVNYDADVTWNQKTPTRRDNAANLIVGVILLAAMVCGLSVLAGVAFGGFRLAVKRLLPGRVFDRPEQLEIIALHLSDRSPQPVDSTVSSSIKVG
jgi:hypothetical protein